MHLVCTERAGALVPEVAHRVRSTNAIAMAQITTITPTENTNVPLLHRPFRRSDPTANTTATSARSRTINIVMVARSIVSCGTRGPIDMSGGPKGAKRPLERPLLDGKGWPLLHGATSRR